MTICRVDRSWIPVPYVENDGEGIVAAFYPDGQLCQLSLSWDGDEAFPRLELASLGGHSSSLFDGRAVHNGGWVGRAVEGYSTELYYPDGRAESFCRWDDSSQPWPAEWPDWVHGWIVEIVERAPRAQEIVEYQRAKAAKSVTPWPMTEVTSFTRTLWDCVVGFGRCLVRREL